MGREGTSRFLRITSWILFIVWSAFWIFLNLVLGLGEMSTDGLPALAGHLLMPIVIIITALLLWRRLFVGAVILLAEAIFAFFIFSVDVTESTWVFLFFTVSLPAFAIGTLFLLSWYFYPKPS